MTILHEFKEALAPTSVREAVGGAILFLGGIIIENVADVNHASLVGLGLGSVLMVDGLRRSEEEHDSEETKPIIG